MSYQTKSYIKCHKTNGAHVFDLLRADKTRIMVTAGGYSRSGNWTDVPHQPDLVIGPRETIKEMSFVPEWMNPSEFLPDFMALEFPDYGVPQLAPECWKSIYAKILENKKITHIHLQCMGGHGRTGLLLSVLWGMCKIEEKSVDEIVTKMRSLYCESAVESIAQYNYIEKATGLPYLGISTPSKTYQNSYNSYGYKAQGELYKNLPSNKSLTDDDKKFADWQETQFDDSELILFDDLVNKQWDELEDLVQELNLYDYTVSYSWPTKQWMIEHLKEATRYYSSPSSVEQALRSFAHKNIKTKL